MDVERIHAWSRESAMVEHAHVSLLNCDLISGARILVHFAGGLSDDGTIVEMSDSGLAAVIEIAGVRWQLSRKSSVHVGIAWAWEWEVNHRCEA